MKSGITPACAGKTRFQISLAVWLWDHPRVCGKNCWKQEDISDSLGSPPRVREKLVIVFVYIAYLRITPACAGKTSKFVALNHEEWDHPRVCGKNTVSNIPSRVAVGSPPRVREKQLHQLIR